jgi:UPF0271 protein
MRIDINCDLGESFGSYKIGEDERVMPFITSANVACGYHAGDPMIMAQTLELAKMHGVAVGAHPGYPDLLGYGRRNLETFPGEIRNYILYQVGALGALARAAGMKLQHVKPHGAMYNLAAKDERTAQEVIEAVKAYDPDLILITLAGSLCAQVASAAGLRVAREVFPDRAYLSNGQLAPRSMAGAVIQDPERVEERVLKLVKTGKMASIDGQQVALDMDTLCVHGDNPGAWKLAKTIRETLESFGVCVLPMGMK